MRTLTPDQQRVKALLKEWDTLTEPLTTPIVYHPGGWEDTVPEELKRQVIQQRIEKQVNGGWDEATDAEVLCYLMTASLVQPLSSDWTQIFLYEGALFMPQVRDAIPDTPKELSDYQKSELRDLKRRIQDSQIKRRKQKKKEGNMTNRKLVMEEHEGKVLMGVQQEGCDPVVKTVEGNLDAALALVPEILTEAQEKWAISPKMPAYKPPAEPKPAAVPAQKAADLPLLQGEAEPVVAEEKAEEQVGGLISKDEAIKIAEEQGGSREEIEATAEAVAEGTEEKVTELTGAAEEQAPEIAVPAAEFVHALEKEGATEEAKAEDMATMREDIAQQPPAAAAPTGEWGYWLKDGRGPYSDIQAAMDAMGLDKETRPHHNRWDRLSTQLKEQIQRQSKA